MEMNLLDIIENNVGIVILLCLTFSFVTLDASFYMWSNKIGDKKEKHLPNYRITQFFWRIVLFIPIIGPMLYLTIGKKLISKILDEDTKRYWDQKAKHDRSDMEFWIGNAQKGDGRVFQMIVHMLSCIENEEKEVQKQIDATKENMSELGKMTMDGESELDDLMRKLASIQPQRHELLAVINELKNQWVHFERCANFHIPEVVYEQNKL